MKDKCLLLIALVMSLVACKPSMPSDVMDSDDMEDVLYDIHMAQSMDGQADSIAVRAYRDAILRKHGISQDEFNHSMAYYTRHADKLFEIYKNLEKRLTDDAGALGMNAEGLTENAFAAKGDTAEIWKGARSIVLSPHELLCSSSFSIAADTTFKPGDHIRMIFDTQFIYQDGMRDGYVILAMKLRNDSVVTRMMRLTSSEHYTLDVMDDTRKGIKEVKGFFLLNRNTGSNTSTTLKLMFVDHIHLLRFHTKEVQNQETVNTAEPNGTIVREHVSVGDEAKALPVGGGPRHVPQKVMVEPVNVQAEIKE